MQLSNGPLPPATVSTAAPVYVDGQRVQISMDPSDAGLRVHVQNGGSGGTSVIDEAAWTAGVSTFNPIGGAFNDSAQALTSGQQGTARVTTNRALHANLRNIAGTEVGTLAAALRTDPTGATTQPVSGTVSVTGVGAAGAVVSGNPMRNGALGRTTLPTGVSSAQLVDLLLDRYGRTYVLSPVLSTASSGGTAITTNTNTAIVAAPTAGTHLRIHRLWAQNSSATGTWCYWGNGSGNKGGPPFFLAQNQPFGMDIKGAWELTSATGLFMNTATTGANIEWYVEYETLTD